MAGDAGKIMEEVVKHLTTLYGANVQVTLEIQAHLPGGVPEETVRTVTENCRTLRHRSLDRLSLHLLRYAALQATLPYVKERTVPFRQHRSQG
jgi:hypothetical protein